MSTNDRSSSARSGGRRRSRVGRPGRRATRGGQWLSTSANRRLRSKLDDVGMLLADGRSRELVPGIVIDADGRIALGDNATEPATWMELAKFTTSSGKLLWALARDERVPKAAKLVAGLAAAYVVSPLDLMPDFVPTIGRIDDIYLVVRSVRYLVDSAGYDVVRDLWDGSDEGLVLLLGLVGMGD
jgi:uncharacterized membrane protein YkvA (DUF1232 family)